MADLITYKGPWAGVDVSMPETEISPQATPFSLNFFNYLNELRTRPKLITNIASPTGELIRTFETFFDINGNRKDVAISTTKLYTSDGITTIGTMGVAGPKQALVPIVYNGVMYYPSGNALYSYDGTTFSNPASAFAGGLFVNKLVSHLLLLNTVEGGSSFPQRVRWSASGLPTVLDPTVNTNAGYVDLDTAEAITGFFKSGVTGVIGTPHSLIQMVPTGSGIQPFAFYNIEDAPDGVGIHYPNSLDSFGIYSIFAAEDDVYLISSIAGLQAIGGPARAAIYSDLLLSTNGAFDTFPFGSPNGPIGTIINIYANNVQAADNGDSLLVRYVSNDGLFYILAIPMSDPIVPAVRSMVFWVYDLKRNCWFRWNSVPSSYWFTTKLWRNPNDNNYPQAGTSYLA